MTRTNLSSLSSFHVFAAAPALLLGLAGCPEPLTPDDPDPTTCGLFSECRDADGCCPTGCHERNDDDCRSVCGDGVLSPDEMCEPFISCPLDCDDFNPCTLDVFTGALETCNIVCTHTPVTWCQTGDGCCVGSCGAPGDGDCRP
jgi:hypothetical protein